MAILITRSYVWSYVSGCLEQVDFCVGQVTFPTHLPNGQVTIYKNLSRQVKLKPWLPKEQVKFFFKLCKWKENVKKLSMNIWGLVRIICMLISGLK